MWWQAFNQSTRRCLSPKFCSQLCLREENVLISFITFVLSDRKYVVNVPFHRLIEIIINKSTPGTSQEKMEQAKDEIRRIMNAVEYIQDVFKVHFVFPPLNIPLSLDDSGYNNLSDSYFCKNAFLFIHAVKIEYQDRFRHRQDYLAYDGCTVFADILEAKSHGELIDFFFKTVNKRPISVWTEGMEDLISKADKFALRMIDAENEKKKKQGDATATNVDTQPDTADDDEETEPREERLENSEDGSSKDGSRSEGSSEYEDDPYGSEEQNEEDEEEEEDSAETDNDFINI